MKLFLAIFSILLFTACERAQNKGYEGPNIVQQAINTKKLELFRRHLESLEPTEVQKLAIAHKELNSKIDGATLTPEEISAPVYLIGSRDPNHDYSMTEYSKVEGARRRLFIFSKPKPGRDYNITNSTPRFTDRKEGDAIIAICMAEQRNELNKISKKFPLLIVLMETKDILITNFPTKKVKDWETPDTKMESAEVVDVYNHDNVTFNNAFYITLPTMWIDGFGFNEKQTPQEYCHGLVTAEVATKNLIRQLRETTSSLTLNLSLEQLMELQK